MRRRRLEPSLLAGLALVASILALVVLAPLLAPHPPEEAKPAVRLQGPSLSYPFGTDHLGRCVLSRILHGGRISLLLTIAVVLGGGILGTLLGGLAGYAGGLPDLALVGLTDLLLALPRLVLALVAVGLAGPSMVAVFLVLTLVDWTGHARVARGVVLKEKEKPYALAERALGFGGPRILFTSLLPAAVPPLLVLSVLRMGAVLLAIAGLGFLGLGVPPPTPEWGAMIGEGRVFLRSAPWIALFPGLLMVLTILGFGLVGEGVRRARDGFGSLPGGTG